MGNLREKPEKSKKTDVYRHKKISFVCSSMCGWRTFMEDNILAEYPFCDSEDLGLFGIFDGHGGPECSQYAVKYFPEILKKNQNFKSKNYEEALTQTFLKVDEMMRSKTGMKQLVSIRQKHVQKGNAQNYNGDSVSGTTAHVCLLTKDFVYVANAGDSRGIAILRGSGNKNKFKILSKDHKPNLDSQKQRILKAGGSISAEGRINNNLNMSRALGDFAYKNNPKLKAHDQIITAVPEITKTPRLEISHIIMGCDGIWETKSNEEMAKWFQKSLQSKNVTLKNVVQSLFNQQIAMNPEQENGLDNMSAIILQI